MTILPPPGQYRIEPHPQMWEQPGPGYMVPSPHVYPPASHDPPPPPPRKWHSSRIALFVVAVVVSAAIWLLGAVALGPAIADSALTLEGFVSACGVASLVLSLLFIILAAKSRFRPVWSILLLGTNVVVPVILVGSGTIIVFLTVVAAFLSM